MNQEREELIQRLTELLSDDSIDIVPAADGYQNQVFIITRSIDRLVARLSSQNGRTMKDIETELDWIAALDSAGISVAKPTTLQGHEQIIALAAKKKSYWLTFFQHTDGEKAKCFFA